MWCPFICRINDFNPSSWANLRAERRKVLKTEARTLLSSTIRDPFVDTPYLNSYLIDVFRTLRHVILRNQPDG